MQIHRIYVLTLLIALLDNPLFAQGALGYNNNRIAISADGNNEPDLKYTGKYNTADPDDWGATPATLVMLAKKQLQEKVVHFSYNNFMPSPPHTTVKNYMKQAADQGIERLQFNGDVFYDVGTHKQEAIQSLKNELMKSSASDPLYFIHMGPSEFFYQAVKAVVDDGTNLESLSHVYVISHSGYNDNHLRREDHHTMDQTIALSGNRLNYKKIKDQNKKEVGYLGWHSKQNAHPWRDIRDHKDPHVQWLWERMQDHKHGKFDISDAGMVYYLLTGDEDGNPSKFTEFIGYGVRLPNDIVAESINIDEEEVEIQAHQAYQLSFGFNPTKPWDDYYTWETSDSSVAYVSPNGRLIGVGTGTATITVTGGIGEFTDQVKVTVAEDDMDCDITSISAINDVNTIEVDGFAPSYKDKARKAIAVNAGKYKGVFGASKFKYEGTSGTYDITITSLTELDGESSYKLKIGDKYIGEFQNPETDTDYKEYTFTFKNLEVEKGAMVQVESNSHSNGKIPEGDAFAFSRGRWKSIAFSCSDGCVPEVKEGFLVIEAERFSLKGDWRIMEDNVASGGKYIQYTGPNSYKKANSKDEISYTFNISTPGTYKVRWFMRQPDEAEGDKSNDVWIKMDGNAGLFGTEPFSDYTKFVGRSKGIFAMNGKLEAHHDFAKFNCNFSEAGEYTIRIAGRSELLQIDKIVFYKNDIRDDDAIFRASEITETTSCMDALILKQASTN